MRKAKITRSTRIERASGPDDIAGGLGSRPQAVSQFSSCSPSDLRVAVDAATLCRDLWGTEQARQLWIQLGLPAPATARLGTATAKTDSSSLVRAFLRECCRLDPAAEERAADLATAYATWAAATGRSSLSRTALGRGLRACGLASRNSRIMVWRGIALRDPPAPSPGASNSICNPRTRTDA